MSQAFMHNTEYQDASHTFIYSGVVFIAFGYLGVGPSSFKLRAVNRKFKEKTELFFQIQNKRTSQRLVDAGVRDAKKAKQKLRDAELMLKKHEMIYNFYKLRYQDFTDFVLNPENFSLGKEVVYELLKLVRPECTITLS